MRSRDVTLHDRAARRCRRQGGLQPSACRRRAAVHASSARRRRSSRFRRTHPAWSRSGARPATRPTGCAARSWSLLARGGTA